MWKFGIYACQDSVFVGGKPGRWIGIHIDLPWSECCREFGAPCRIYLHWWPGKCKSINLPLKNPHEGMWDMSGPGVKMVRIIRSCAICHTDIDKDAPLYYMTAKYTVRQANGIERDTGTSGMSLCPHHGRMATMGAIHATYVERP